MVTLTFVAHRTQRDGRAASVSRFAEAEPQSDRVANTSPLGRRSRIFLRFCRHWFTNGLLRAPHFIVNPGNGSRAPSAGEHGCRTGCSRTGAGPPRHGALL